MIGLTKVRLISKKEHHILIPDLCSILEQRQIFSIAMIIF